ncbi:5'/3'-nucleotidase SurE [Halarchaeum nitratireducens]|uniref:5'-nucleotidase SurE n=1 Tax=Halarchaeum nitratireducens TaxID=489913 RepID=A0A830GBH2_9EURY|nr:5'/3'-nucleotidase SurE [Halarchaeum nitratireducens]GGN15770.1 5'/3'-nucleotidase SurE [Halarchaeum nitratireducens]
MSTLSVLLTNDDGIDAPGLERLRDRLDADHDVTVVAPAGQQSGTGQTRTAGPVEYHDHARGYAVEGTPADCVAVGLAAIGLEPDVVVSGCNDGPNLGAHVLGRSGTVGAAMEAGFLDVPAVALSMYDWDLTDPDWEPTTETFDLAAEVAADLVPAFAAGDVLPSADYLSVNAPASDQATAPVRRVTRPSEEYELEATVTGAGIDVEDRFWAEFLERDVPDPEGTDRRVCVDNEVSVTPLTAPHGVPEDVTPGGVL